MVDAYGYFRNRREPNAIWPTLCIVVATIDGTDSHVCAAIRVVERYKLVGIGRGFGFIRNGGIGRSSSTAIAEEPIGQRLRVRAGLMSGHPCAAFFGVPGNWDA